MHSLVNFFLIFLFILNSFVNSDVTLDNNINSDRKSEQNEVDCFGLGTIFANTLEWFYKQKETDKNPLYTQFYMLSRKSPHRSLVLIGDQFGLDWTNFDIRRKTIVIVHGFLSNGNEDWIHDMEDAFLLWGDVNVIIVDWSAGSNTWNYYKAAVNTRIVGTFIAKLFKHIANATIDSQGPPENEWGKIHFVGHSLGAHICSFAANLLTKSQKNWKVERITGLDPAQPCFRNADSTLTLDKYDAPFVDVIHTNGKLLTSMGLGLPTPIGHMDFYPNGGQMQPGCGPAKPSYVPLPQTVINQAICSHGRSHTYFTESILSEVQKNCTFWAHHWDLTYRRAVTIVDEKCSHNNCAEMGINSINYRNRGTFFSLTSASAPHCSIKKADKEKVLSRLSEDLRNEYLD